MFPKIGLALGSGGARGIAHIGVLQVLEEHEIPVHYIVGSSIGALIGCLYAAGQTPSDLEKLAKLFRKRYYLDFTVPKMGLIQGNRLKQVIAMLVKNKKLEELDIPTTIVATDLKQGEQVLFKEGEVEQAVRASISIPGIFVPEKIGEKWCVDGGVIDRVPASTLKEQDVDVTIAVDVSFFEENIEITSIYDVIMQSMEIMGRELMQEKEINADAIIRPITTRHHTFEFEESEKLIAAGREETERLIPTIKEKISEWKELNHESTESTETQADA
ncbi:patatin-like phospholipase family protein [Salsuginibacillus kocurii]|uniref:patatin-like phospholipase family protein n=1 Tax=Salsuginibacillus kocurii TaxID=427078 RepID=UPI0003617741|nr:patatin-like phospholipase family protein [Salsuginibacillus kocurii]